MLELRKMVVYTQYERPVVFEHKHTLAADLTCPLCKKDIENNSNMLMVRCSEERFPITYIHIECVSENEPIRADWHRICVCLEDDWAITREALRRWRCWLPSVII
jgi:hypothetical protein